MIIAIHQSNYAPWLRNFTKWRRTTRSFFSLPVSEEFSRRILSLPMHAYISRPRPSGYVGR
ncbi:MAG: hypothetical protein O3A94_15525 [Proteobacteria bacterium]|nr:hypothetical protein [Pseudomonadota bacterium]